MSDRCTRTILLFLTSVAPTLASAQTGEDLARELARAGASMAAGNHGVAVTILKDVVARKPDLGLAWYQLAIAQRGLSRQVEAFRAAENAERLLPESVDAKLLLAELCASGDAARASAIATDLMAGKDDPELLRRLLPILITARDDRVKQVFGRLQTAAPTDTALLQQKMQWALENHDLPTAIEALQRHVTLEPENPLPLQSLANVQLAAGKTEGAKTTLSRLLELNPSNTQVRGQLIQILVQQKAMPTQIDEQRRLLAFYEKQKQRWQREGKDAEPIDTPRPAPRK